MSREVIWFYIISIIVFTGMAIIAWGTILQRRRLLVLTGLFLFSFDVVAIFSPCVMDYHYAVQKNYETAAGTAMFDSTGTRLPWETITIYDDKTGGKLKISAFTKKVTKGDYLEIKYLPHTKFGIVEERIDGKDYKKYSEDGPGH